MLSKLVTALMNSASNRAFKFENGENEGDAASLYLYDAIGFWNITAQEFVDQLNEIDAPVINLYINSPGGDVFMARAMKTALERHSAKIIAHIDGIAASAASYLMMAAEEINIAEGAMVMIHNASGLCWGNAESMRKTAGVLDKIDDTIVADYKKKTGLKESALKQMMADETWMKAEEAKDKGFVDKIVAGKEAKAPVVNLSDVYDNVPDDIPDAQNIDNDFINEQNGRMLALVEATGA